MPTVHAIDGFVGISMLVNRGSGRCIVTTAWETPEAMFASAREAGPLRDGAVNELGGTVEKMEEWEIAVLHRDRYAVAGAWARVTWVKVDPRMWDQDHNYYRTTVLPDLRSLDGFLSSSLLVDRVTGLSVATATFESRDALERNRNDASAQKHAKMPREGAQEIDEGEFELVLAHLRVPESV